MKRRVLAGFVLCAGLVQAITIPPTCDSLGNLQAFLTSGACTAGVFTIKNPTFSGPVSASSVGLSVLSGPASVAVIFGGSGSPFTSEAFSTTSFTFGYTIDPPPDIIKGVEAQLEDAGQDFFGINALSTADAGDAIFVQYLLCAGAAFDGDSCAGELEGFTLNLADQSGDQLRITDLLAGGVVFDSPVNTVGVKIQVDLTNGGQFSALNSSFPLEAPEPGTWAMLGMGLAACWRARFRRS